MRRGVSLGVVAAAALALAGPAAAAYSGVRLTVVNAGKRTGAGGPVTLTYAQRPGDDATARIVTYVPRGYVSSLVPRVGDVLGTGSAAFAAGRQAGTIRAADPAAHSERAEACTGTGVRLDAVYVLGLPNRELPIFVRTVTSGPEAAYASGALTVCFAADEDARVRALSLTFPGLFANPIARGAYRWRSLWTPYRDGEPDADGTVEAQSLDPLPLQLTLAAGRLDPKTRAFFAGGTLLENRRSVVGASVRLFAGRTERGVRSLAATRTNANGNYGGPLRLAPGTWYLRARATVRARTRNGCAVRTVPSVRCLRTTTAGYTVWSGTVEVVVPPR